MSRTWAARSAPINLAISSKPTFSSCCPFGALVDGVKIGSGSAVRHAQPGGQLDAADLAGALVVLPAGADQVTAHDGFDRQRLQLADDDRAIGEAGAVAGVRHDLREVRVRRRGEVIRHDVARAREPEVGNARQNAALAGDRVGQHHVERAQAVGGDDQHVPVVARDRVDVAHLALVDAREAVQVRLVHRRGAGRRGEGGSGRVRGHGGGRRCC